MKMFLSLLIGMTAAAHAQTPEFRAKNYTCQELKEALATHGSIVLVKKVLFFKDKTLVHASVACEGTYEYRRHPTFKTADEKHCQIGEICEYSPPAPTYTPSDSGYSGGSDWGSSGGSSYDPPDRSDRGSSYDPPDRSDRGSSYDPPDRGDRGSRYCPGC